MVHPKSGHEAPMFGYDMGSVAKKRTKKRRETVCPTKNTLSRLMWRQSHPCPEINAQSAWRQDGQWWTSQLDDATSQGTSELKRRTNPDGSQERSGIRYSCDEFPPATFVEGGSGLDKSTPANTRCAAMACTGLGNRAEQDWQGKFTTHPAFQAARSTSIADILLVQHRFTGSYDINC